VVLNDQKSTSPGYPYFVYAEEIKRPYLGDPTVPILKFPGLGYSEM